MSVRAQVSGLVAEASSLLDQAADALGEDETLSEAGRVELEGRFRLLEAVELRLRNNWAARLLREVRGRDRDAEPRE